MKRVSRFFYQGLAQYPFFIHSLKSFNRVPSNIYKLQQTAMTSKLIVLGAIILLIGAFPQNSICGQRPVSNSHLHFQKEPPSICPSTSEFYLKEMTEELSMRAPPKIPWSEYAGYRSRNSQRQIEESVSLHVPSYCVYDYDLDKNGGGVMINNGSDIGIKLLLDWGRRSEKLGFTRDPSVTITFDMGGCELGNRTQVQCFPVSRRNPASSNSSIDYYNQYQLVGEQVIWFTFEPPLHRFIVDLKHHDNEKEENPEERIWSQLGEVFYVPIQARNVTMEQLSTSLGDDNKQWILAGIGRATGSPEYAVINENRLN